MNTISNIPFQNIENIPQLIKDFLEKKSDYFSDVVFSNENILRQIVLKQQSFSQQKRNVLSEVLVQQHSDLTLTEKQQRNIESLVKENTFTITTGHQLNLFTGPVFFIYKILQGIKISENLNKYFPDYNFVPLFWMASEDHDFEEINHFVTQQSYYEINADYGGAVGKIKIEDQHFISQFEEEFKDTIFGTELILLIKKAYKKEYTLSQAIKILVQEIFSEYGLLIIDGDHPKLKSEIKDIFKEELLSQILFNYSKDDVQWLEDKYGKVQVNPREINLFYLSDTRNRIEKREGYFEVLNKNLKFTEEEILTELENYPEKFSPNALMRPVYQENILPNILYLGGNSEIMYWLELKDFFKKINIPFPVLVPRNSLLFISEKNIRKIEKLGLSVNDFFMNFAELTKRFLLNDNKILNEINEKENILKSNFRHLAKVSQQTDKTFLNLVQAEEKRQIKSYERMKKRLLRAEKIKQKETLEKLENLFLEIHPGKNWQERVYNFSVFYSNFGTQWLQNCYNEMNAENSELIIFKI